MRLVEFRDHFSRAAIVVGGLAVILSVPSVASAQLGVLGGSNLVTSGGVRGTDSAYDPTNHIYLTVGAYGTVKGVFVDTNHLPIGSAFSLNDNADVNVIFAHYPRVTYSPHINGTGGFLVTWHQNDGPGGANIIHTRIVTFTGGLGASGTVNSGDQGSWWEAGAPAAYSPTNQLFLVAWQTCCGGGSVVKFRMVDLNGQPVGSVVQVSGGYGRDPGVAWNPSTNQFGISFDGEDLTSVMSAFALVSGGGQLLRRNVFHRSVATYITDVAYNPATGNYVMAFSDPYGGGMRGAELNSAGDAISEGVLSTVVGSYDGLGLAYNAVSGTFLMTGHHQTSLNVGALELNKRGGRSSADRVVSSTVPIASIGSFYPRPASATDLPRWLVSYSRDYGGTYVQGVETVTTGGGADQPMGPTVNPVAGPSPTPTPTPTPSPTPAPAGGCATPDPFVAMGGGTCINGGWHPPGAAAPTPTPTPGPAPTPTPAPAPTGGCLTPNPFLAMNSGYCVNGGWTMQAPAGAPTPTPTPSPAPTPTPTPAPAPNTCSTPNPFGGLGTCYNGGWYPPGMVVPNSNPAPTPTPTPTPAPSSCVTPDPFVAIGGGACINGGWIPRNQTLCSGFPDPFVAIGGGVCINGGWIPLTAFR